MSRAVHDALGALSTAVASFGVSENGASEQRPERVQSASFAFLEAAGGKRTRVLLLTYAAGGWQCWDVDSPGAVRELVSLRDGLVSALIALPDAEDLGAACMEESASEAPHLTLARPLFAVAGPDAESAAVAVESGSPPLPPLSAPSLVRVYSVAQQGYVRSLPFRTAVLSLRATARVVAVALSSQIYGFHAHNLQLSFSVLTYPTPEAPPTAAPHAICVFPVGPVALGLRWLAYASAEAPAPVATAAGGQAVRLASSPGGGGGGAAMVAHFAKVGGRQLAAGVKKAGDSGFKALSKYLPGRPFGSPPTEQGSLGSSATPAEGCGSGGSSGGGTVLVRDLATSTVLAHFRAHASPLCCLQWNPAGRLLLTASTRGGALNVFSLAPGQPGCVQHLYRLHRGWSPATVQHVAFSSDSAWLTVSTARGTTHLYAVNPHGGPVNAETHAFRHPSHGGPSARSRPAPPPMESLSACCRVRAAGDGWLGAVQHRASQAAAAAGLTDGAAGAMAAALRTLADSDTGGGGASQRELLVLAPCGSLTRYALRPRAAEGDTSAAPDAAAALAADLLPLERCDVRRSPSWPERCEAPPAAASGTPTGDAWEDACWLAQAQLRTHASSPPRSQLDGLPPPPSYAAAVPPWARPLSPPQQQRTAAQLPVEDGAMLVSSSPRCGGFSPSTPGGAWRLSDALSAGQPLSGAEEQQDDPPAEATDVATSVYRVDAAAAGSGEMQEAWGSDEE